MDMVKAAPLVSVVMAAYNAQDFVEAAIVSVIEQTFADWEMIIVDDSSNDGTYLRIEAFAERDRRIRLLRNELNSGVSITRNLAIEHAKGKYIAFIDSDDVWHPQKLERQIEMVRSSGAEFCYSSYSIITAEGSKARADYIVPGTVSYNDILKENCILCSAMFIEAELVRRFMFTTEFYHEDYVLSLNLLRNGCKAVGCREVLVDWRYLEKSRSFNKFRSAKNRWKIYRDFLKLSWGKSVFYFANYAITGLRKYSCMKG